jgi:VWFA-related protein
VAANDVLPEGRVFALVLDDQLTQPARTRAVRRLARQFVDEHAGPADLIAVFSTSGRGVLTQEFTTDHTRVAQAIDRFQGNRIRNAERDPERVYSIQVAMDVLARLADHLSAVRGRRVAVLWFSEGVDYDLAQAMRPSSPSGFDLSMLTMDRIARETAAGPEPTAVIRAMQDAMDALARANVALYSVDPRGLYGLEGEKAEYSGRDPAAPPAPDPQELARSIQSLRTVAERTGGFALVDTSDFAAPFERIIQESSAYYVLGYSPTNQGRPGEYRRIAVRTRSGLRVSARPGYVVPPPRNQPAASPVMAAIDDSLPRPQLPIRVQAVPLPGRDDTLSDLQVIVEVDGGGLSFRSDGGAHVERVAFALKTVDDLAREANRTSTG